MNFRNMNLRIFQGEPVPHVLFQPRLEPWYDWHKRFGKLPPGYENHNLLDIYDELGLSMRYVDYYTGQPRPIIETWDAPVHTRDEGSQRTVFYETPYGNLTETQHFTQDETWRTTGFAVKTVDDLKKLRWLYQHRRFSFSVDRFEQGSAFIGDRGVPQFWVTRSPYQSLAIDWMRYEDFVYALADYPAEVEATLKAIDDSYDSLYEEIIGSGKAQIINFGENIHGHLITPRAFERYMIPFFEKRSGQLRAAGIFTYVHIDGYFKSLLKYLKDMPFDGYEALTPVPQGDVTIEEMAEHIGDKVLLDGIPAVYFLPTYSREDLMASVEKLIKLFHPRLVLGVSDEVPEGAGVEALERVRLVADYCRSAG